MRMFLDEHVYPRIHSIIVAHLKVAGIFLTGAKTSTITKECGIFSVSGDHEITAKLPQFSAIFIVLAPLKKYPQLFYPQFLRVSTELKCAIIILCLYF